MKRLLIIIILALLLTSCEEKKTVPDTVPIIVTDPEVEDDTEVEDDPVVDTAAPILSLIGESQLIVEYGSIFSDPGASFTDNVDDDGVVYGVGMVNIYQVGSYALVYQKTDSSGNVSDVVTRTVFVVDTTEPVITVNGDIDITLEVGTTYTELGATYIDNVDGNGTPVINGVVDDTTVGTYVVTYTYIDSSNNTGTVNRTVHIVDTTDPILTLNGQSEITLEYGTLYTELGATYTDNVDSAGNAVISGEVDTDLGTYVLTYSYTDSSDNTASINRIVHIVDTTDPVITVLGNINYTYREDAPNIADYITAIDNYDGDVISTLDHTFDINDYYSPGSYSLLVTVTDSSGNIASTNLIIDFSLGIVSDLTEDEEWVVGGVEVLFDVLPEQITLSVIGEEYEYISQIDESTGIGFINDGDFIEYALANKVTAKEYLEIVESYNTTLNHMYEYLDSPFFGLYHIEALSTEYINGATSMFMVKISDDQYELVIHDSSQETPVLVKVLIDILPFVGNYNYGIDVYTEEARYHYEVLRGSTYITSITEVIEFYGNNEGVLYTNHYYYDGNSIEGVIIKDEIVLTRRMYFNFSEEKKGIYYVEDETGFEKYLSLEPHGELVFEYENNPSQSTENVRWILGRLLNLFGIEYSEGVSSNEYIITYAIDQIAYITESDFFTIEAKNYLVYEYDDINKVYYTNTAGSWTLLMKGDFENNFDAYFELEDFISVYTNFDVKLHIESILYDKDVLTLFDESVLNITAEEILAEIK